MASPRFVAPRLPAAPVEYDQRFMDAALNIVRLYFNQLDAQGPVSGATNDDGTTLVSGLSFSVPDRTNPNASAVSLPTEADVARLRVGDVYYDTTAGNVLKVKV